MGGSWSQGVCGPKDEIIRRDPLTEASDILVNTEALDMIWFALQTCPPGTKMRWDKLVATANRLIEPTDEQPDPIRLEIDLETLKTILKSIYTNTQSGTAEGLKLMRELMPKFYDKHSYERGKKVSQYDRNKYAITDECYSYGEVEYEVFATIYSKVSRAYGHNSEIGWFMDLGCGVGQLVYAAALMGNFKRCYGIENIDSLLERGSKRATKYQMARSKLPEEKRSIEFQWIKEDFLEKTRFWYDCTVFFLHWTAFNNEQVARFGKLFNQANEGAIIISLTRPVPNENLVLLAQDRCKTSFGETDFFVQEKLTVASERPANDFMAEFGI